MKHKNKKRHLRRYLIYVALIALFLKFMGRPIIVWDENFKGIWLNRGSNIYYDSWLGLYKINTRSFTKEYSYIEFIVFKDNYKEGNVLIAGRKDGNKKWYIRTNYSINLKNNYNK